MIRQVVLLPHVGPLSDPAIQVAAICFVMVFLGWVSCGLWLLKTKSKGPK